MLSFKTQHVLISHHNKKYLSVLIRTTKTELISMTLPGPQYTDYLKFAAFPHGNMEILKNKVLIIIH